MKPFLGKPKLSIAGELTKSHAQQFPFQVFSTGLGAIYFGEAS